MGEAKEEEKSEKSSVGSDWIWRSTKLGGWKNFGTPLEARPVLGRWQGTRAKTWTKLANHLN